MGLCYACGKLFANGPDKCPQCGMPVLIPHGANGSADRRYFADRVTRVSAAIFCENGVWHAAPKQHRPPDGTEILVEVWEAAGAISIHPSRNRFHWVHAPNKRAYLHGLAQDPARLMTFSSAAFARARRPGHRAQPVHHHRVATPRWATADLVVGYTCAFALNLSGGPQPPLMELPSIYYRQGHATLDHETPGNVGWKYGPPNRCVLFANAPKRHLLPPH